MRVTAGGGFGALNANAALANRNLFERLLIGTGALVRTAAKLFVPAGLSGDGSSDPVLSARASIPEAYWVALALVAVVLMLVAIAVWWRRAGPVSAAIGLFVVLSIPVLQIVPIGAVFEDRFAYAPSLALLVIVGLLAESVVTHVRPKALAASALLIALGSFGLASWRTAADWHDDETFNRALLAEDPGNVRAIDRLSHEWIVRSDHERALAHASPARNDAERAWVKERYDSAGARVSENKREIKGEKRRGAR